jgi:serine/threonine-protein kinase
VLDFGLAKAFTPSEQGINLSNSPTMSMTSMAATQQGIIMGTAGYMSPEQASGESADKRADIWAFGVVLFEMLTGRRMFAGKTVAHLLADILKAEPNWNSLPANLHPRIRLLLERCLEKEPQDRYHDIADARVDIERVLSDPNGVVVQPESVAASSRIGRSPLVWMVTVAVALFAGVLGWFLHREPAAKSAPVVRFPVFLPAAAQFSTPAARGSLIRRIPRYTFEISTSRKAGPFPGPARPGPVLPRRFSHRTVSGSRTFSSSLPTAPIF